MHVCWFLWSFQLPQLDKIVALVVWQFLVSEEKSNSWYVLFPVSWHAHLFGRVSGVHCRISNRQDSNSFSIKNSQLFFSLAFSWGGGGRGLEEGVGLISIILQYIVHKKFPGLPWRKMPGCHLLLLLAFLQDSSFLVKNIFFIRQKFM